MTPPPTDTALRERDVRIAKLLGWRVERSRDVFVLFDPSGVRVDASTSEEGAWFNVPHYSTDIRDAAGLLVEVTCRGWCVMSIERLPAHLHLTRVAIGHDFIKIVNGESALTDPQAAWCAAVSEACLKALEAEVVDAV